jgi:mannose-6-phosphate isomerase-like protein (cupin superfamily)
MSKSTRSGDMQPIDLEQKFSLFDEPWRQKTVAKPNGQEVKLVKILGLFPWHRHLDVDEMFLVWRGKFRVEFRDEIVELGAGQMIVVPRGVEHRTASNDGAEVIVFEPEGVVNTGDAPLSEFTASSNAGI